MNDMRRSATRVRDGEKIGIRRYDSEPVGASVLPNSLVPGDVRQTCCENMDRIGKEFGQTVNQFGGKIRVK
jgi:hypothetical protein